MANFCKKSHLIMTHKIDIILVEGWYYHGIPILWNSNGWGQTNESENGVQSLLCECVLAKQAAEQALHSR